MTSLARQKQTISCPPAYLISNIKLTTSFWQSVCASSSAVLKRTANELAAVVQVVMLVASSFEWMCRLRTQHPSEFSITPCFNLFGWQQASLQTPSQCGKDNPVSFRTSWIAFQTMPTVFSATRMIDAVNNAKSWKQMFLWSNYLVNSLDVNAGPLSQWTKSCSSTKTKSLSQTSYNSCCCHVLTR